jgi:hypothetical protein
MHGLVPTLEGILPCRGRFVDTSSNLNYFTLQESDRRRIPTHISVHMKRHGDTQYDCTEA